MGAGVAKALCVREYRRHVVSCTKQTRERKKGDWKRGRYLTLEEELMDMVTHTEDGVVHTQGFSADTASCVYTQQASAPGCISHCFGQRKEKKPKEHGRQTVYSAYPSADLSTWAASGRPSIDAAAAALLCVGVSNNTTLIASRIDVDHEPCHMVSSTLEENGSLCIFIDSKIVLPTINIPRGDPQTAVARLFT